MDRRLLVTKDCRHGRLTYLRTDTIIGRSLDLYGEWSEGEIILFRRLLTAGDVVLDVGANIGTHTLALSPIVESSGAVYAFEPQPLIFNILSENIEANGLSNVVANCAAVGANDGQTRIPIVDYSVPGNFGEVAVGNGTLKVPMIAIDGLNLARANLIKIDAEGAESDVLQGAAKTIARCRPNLYVENNTIETSASLVTLIRSMGYRVAPFGAFQSVQFCWQ
jgi:FkbM family methyltransferase